MTVTRRHLFRLTPVVLAAAVMPRKMFGAPQAEGGTLAMSKAGFQPLVGKSFTVNSAAGKTSWLTLASIEEAEASVPAFDPRRSLISLPAAPAPKTETFTLKFYGTGEPLAQGTYTLEHFSVGQLKLFIVPAGSSTYAAVINHLLEPLPANYSIPRKKIKQQQQ